MGKRSRMKKENADLDIELDSYEPSSGSDNEYDDNEKLMLEQAAKRRSKKPNDDDDDESEEEVFGIHNSEDDEDDVPEPLGEEMDSDIEGKDEDGDRLPDSKAWGTRKGIYYKTDYVDEDYGGFSKAEEEEAALKEEEEARSIQARLIAELDDPSIFPVSLDISKKSSEKKQKDVGLEDDELAEVIKADLSKLSTREKMMLLEKESPEFKGLVLDFKERMAYARDNLEPILKLVKSGEIPKCPAATFVETKYHTTLNYCTNIAFYLLLKSKRLKVATHPVIKRLVQYRKLLEEMDPIDHEVIQPQVKEILTLKEKGKVLKVLDLSTPSLPVVKGNRAERRKMLQQLRDEHDEAKKSKVESFEDIQMHGVLDESGSEDADIEDETEKRGITFEIAKNKGLTPKRKKENRNPRVKHRNKFRKASIRRKGQVQTPYKEKKPDGTVPFGIKAGVVKSVKLK